MEKQRAEETKIKDHEDVALKMAAQFFGDVMLPYCGIEGEIISYGPTELVQAEVRKLYEDLFPLLLCPLMSGKSAQKDRMIAAYRITREAVMVDEEDVKKIQAVMYIMAEKFLKGKDLEKFKEEVKMTKLGQMLVEDGRREGRSEGIIIGIVKMCKEFNLSKSDAVDRVVGDSAITKEEAEITVEKYW